MSSGYSYKKKLKKKKLCGFFLFKCVVILLALKVLSIKADLWVPFSYARLVEHYLRKNKIKKILI